MYIGLHAMYLLFLSDFNQIRLSRNIFEKSSKVKFHENPPVGAELF
jgi:hypothetical protein